MPSCFAQSLRDHLPLAQVTLHGGHPPPREAHGAPVVRAPHGGKLPRGEVERRLAVLAIRRQSARLEARRSALLAMPDECTERG